MDKELLEANKHLSKKIDKLQEENKELFYFKENFFNLEKYTRELEKRLEMKRKVVRVVKMLGHISYVLKVIKVEDSPEGMFIVVNDG